MISFQNEWQRVYTGRPRQHKKEMRTMIVYFTDGNKIKVPYDTWTRVVHVLHFIMINKNLVSSMDFDLYIEVNHGQHLFKIDPDNYIENVIYDYDSLNHKFCFRKTFFFPFDYEKIDLQHDPVRLELIFHQLLALVKSSTIELKVQEYVWLIAQLIFIEFVKDNTIFLKDLIRRSFMVKIMPKKAFDAVGKQKMFENVELQLKAI